MIHNYIPVFFFLISLFTRSSIVHASDEPKTNVDKAEWSIGVGIGAFDFLLYPGAVESKRYILPVPYFTYRSPRFEVDRGFRTFLYNSNNLVLDISADFGPPVDSSDTQARKGMPDLDLMLQVGPSLEFKLTDRKKGYFDVRFELPFRIAFVTDLADVENIGYLIEPRFSFDHRRSINAPVAHKTTIGINFATQDFSAYYYDVAPEFATPVRPAYKSDAGFAGSFIKHRISYKTKDYIYWMFLRYQSLRGAVFEDSPLVLKNDYYLVGIGFSWIFANSL